MGISVRLWWGSTQSSLLSSMLSALWQRLFHHAEVTPVPPACRVFSGMDGSFVSCFFYPCLQDYALFLLNLGNPLIGAKY